MKILPLLLLSLLVAGSSPAESVEPKPVQPRPAFNVDEVQWKELHFVARKLFLVARSEIQLTRHRISKVSSEWVASPQGRPEAPQGRRVLQVRIGSSFAGRDTVAATFFDPNDGTAIHRYKERFGRKAYLKKARFTQEGIFHFRQAPANENEAAGESKRWTKIEERFVDYAAKPPCRNAISEPSVLFYMVSSTPLDGPMEVCLESDSQPMKVRISPEGVREIDVDFKVQDDIDESERSGKISAHRLAIAPVAAGNEDDLEILGLEGAVVLYVEKGTGIPVRVDGRIGGAGNVSVKLEKVKLR